MLLVWPYETYIHACTYTYTYTHSRVFMSLWIGGRPPASAVDPFVLRRNEQNELPEICTHSRRGMRWNKIMRERARNDTRRYIRNIPVYVPRPRARTRSGGGRAVSAPPSRRLPSRRRRRYMCVHIYIYIHYVCMYVCVSLSLSIYIYIYMYVYIYIYMHIYIYIYIYIYALHSIQVVRTPPGSSSGVCLYTRRTLR